MVNVLLIVLKSMFYIVIVVFCLIVGILFLPVNTEIIFIDKKLTYKVCYWLLTLYDSNGKGIIKHVKKQKKKQKKYMSDMTKNIQNAKTNTSDTFSFFCENLMAYINDYTYDDNKNFTKTLSEKFDLLLYILKIFKVLKFRDIYINFIIANKDAYKCALDYVRISGTIFNLLGWLGMIFNMKYQTVDITPGFAKKKVAGIFH